MGQAVAREFDLRYTCRRGFVDLHAGIRQAHILKAANDLAPIVIVSHSGDEVDLRSQGVRMVGEIGRSSAQYLSSGEQIPQHFADAGNVDVHKQILLLAWRWRSFIRIQCHHSMPICF